MNRLLNIGFTAVGHWFLLNEKIRFSLSSHHSTSNILYCYISNGEIKYIGKTRMRLSQRMYGYQNPGPSQRTNIRVNDEIFKLLNDGKPLDIFILADNGLLKYGDFRINLAAGLEDTLIFELNPEWNLSGKNVIPMDEASEELVYNEDVFEGEELIPGSISFDIKLGQAYYNQGFFNVSKENSHRFGPDKSIIEIQLGKDSNMTVQGYINRTANTNGTPRIMGGRDLRDWIKESFQFNDIVKVDIISPVSIRLNRMHSGI